MTSRNRVSSIYVFFIILLLALISISSFLSFKSMEHGTNKIYNYAIPLGTTTNDLLTQLINEETGLRGYLVTKDQSFLEPYYSGKKKLDTDLQFILKHKNDFPVLQSSEFQQLLRQIDRIQIFYEHQISLVQAGKIADAKKNVSDGKLLMDGYRDIHKKVKDQITDVTNTAFKSNNTTEKFSLAIILIGCFVAAVIGVLTVNLFLKSRQTEKDLQKSEEQLRVLLEHASDAILVFSLTDDNTPDRYLEVNQAACQLLGYSREELLLMSPVNLTPRERREKIPSLMDQIQKNGHLTFEGAYIAKNGSLIPFEYSASILSLGQEKVVMSIARNITERKKAEKMMEQMAYYDHLTNLANRRLFEERLAEEMDQASTNDEMLAVLFLDLDGFKQINDTFGHESGDLLLQEVAKRLNSCVRKGDLAARLAGDEFTIILPNTTNDGSLLVANRILETLAQPIIIKNEQMHITSSIGISFSQKETLDMKTLIKQADAAMYAAKEQGKNKFQLYESESP